jgi:hypothetical protein
MNSTRRARCLQKCKPGFLHLKMNLVFRNWKQKKKMRAIVKMQRSDVDNSNCWCYFSDVELLDSTMMSEFRSSNLWWTMWILFEFVKFLSVVNHVDFVWLCQIVMVPTRLPKFFYSITNNPNKWLIVKLIVILLQVSSIKNVFTPSWIFWRKIE